MRGNFPRFQKKFERNSTPVSEVYAMFLRLQDIFAAAKMPLTKPAVINKCVTSRFDFAHGDANKVGYLLDARYCGRRMDMDTRE